MGMKGIAMETLEYRVQECEKRIDALEKRREKDNEAAHATKEKLLLSAEKIGTLIEQVEKMPDMIEKSVMKCVDLLKKDHENIYARMNEMDDRINELQKELDDRTIKASAKKFADIKTLIASTIITGIITFLLGMFFG